MFKPIKYNLHDLLIAKHIAELMLDRAVDFKVLKILNKAIMEAKLI